jgi:hypothetical protein
MIGEQSSALSITSLARCAGLNDGGQQLTER